MASVWKRPVSRYWIACFRDERGQQRRASTKETDRKQALKIAQEYQEASRKRRTMRQLRATLERLHEEFSGQSVPQKSLRAYAAEWLASKKPEIDARTYYSYSRGLDHLVNHLGKKADTPLTDITKSELVAYRKGFGTVFGGTANVHPFLLWAKPMRKKSAGKTAARKRRKLLNESFA